ncbi:DUF6076 domain-containing protein [Oscillibacter sp.]|uniref:DUF6076 domain-containing protein n=1 Tax=Oscillibacter sp. TaxID=1945593 RepID=UPI00289FB62E|nr:DUF6076 domain-containing protein [Oscillibacter sp.]
MPIGERQTNNMLHLSLDVWRDQVFFHSRAYPAGYFANGIMNAPLDEVNALLDQSNRIAAMTRQLHEAQREELSDLLPEAKRAVSALLDGLRRYPPYCLMSRADENEVLDVIFSDASVNDISKQDSPVREFFFRYLAAAVMIPWGIYNFLCGAWFLELNYLRRLKKRDETHFAVAAHDCFSSESFQKEMRELTHSGYEPFTVMPSLRSSYVFARSPQNKKAMVFVNRVLFDHIIDFYIYDLMNGLHCGHAPSKCLGCGKFFLTTNAHTPKYCDGVSPQNSKYTCRQYGALIRQKEQNENHPVYALFKTRTNTIRKHLERKKISPALRAAAITMAETYRDKALFDNAYAAAGYALDMELANLYAEAERRLE